MTSHTILTNTTSFVFPEEDGDDSIYTVFTAEDLNISDNNREVSEAPIANFCELSFKYVILFQFSGKKRLYYGWL